MKRFDIKKDMIFGHADIGTIWYHKDLNDYVLRKPDPHKLFNWELLESHGIVSHINDRISGNDARHLKSKVLYKIGDKNTNILKLKQRLNNLFYKIKPWSDKEGNIILPDNNYSNEFDENFMWTVYQFSIRNLPQEIRKDLPLSLEQQDIFPKFLGNYWGIIDSEFKHMNDKILMLLKPYDLNKKDYRSLLAFLTKYKKEVSRSAFDNLTHQMKIYYDSYLRYAISSFLYEPFKSNTLDKIDVLQQEILSLQSLDGPKVTEVVNLLSTFKMQASSAFQSFEKEHFEKYQEAWKKEFLPSIKKQVTWTALHEEILKYLEKSRLEN
jgi:hypothetical protein